MTVREMNEIIDDSEMVLIGIGEEFEEGIQCLEHSDAYAIFREKIDKEALEEEKFLWMYPYLLKSALKERIGQDRIRQAYQVLSSMIENKNYFIVTMNIDDVIFEAGLNPERVAAPFGNYTFYQCENGCEDRIWEDSANIQKITEDILSPDILLTDILQPVCPDCGGKVVFNTVNAKKYLEKGYLEKWKAYMMWLQGTLNRKLCVIEMGVSLQYPSVIRWPFEKTAGINQKSKFIRINSKLPQLTDDISSRGFSIQESAVEFLIKDVV